MNRGRRRVCLAGASGIALLGASCGARVPLTTGAIDDPYVPPLPFDAGAPDGAVPLGPALCGADAVAGGKLATLAVGSARRLTDDSTYDVWLCRDDRGVYALNNECTHASCPLQLVGGPRFYCRCHGAEFDFNGEHPTAPAIQPLEHYAVCDDGAGNARVDLALVVAPASRLP